MEKMYISQAARQLRAIVITTILFATGTSSFAAETDVEYAAASTVITTLHEKLLYIMQNSNDLKYQGRYDGVYDTVTSSFDAALIARVMMSRCCKQVD